MTENGVELSMRSLTRSIRRVCFPPTINGLARLRKHTVLSRPYAVVASQIENPKSAAKQGWPFGGLE